MASQPIPLVFDIRNLGQLREANATLKAMGSPSGSVARATKSTMRMGSAVQNASFQITDFIVQVEGGVSATRALGQQLPQLLGGFGAMGAAIGVVVSLLPAAVRLFSDSNDEVKELDKAIADLNDSLGELDSNDGLFTGAKIVNNLDAITRSLREQARAYQELSLIQKVISAGEDFFGVFLSSREDRRLQNIQEQLKVTREVAQQVDTLTRQFSIGFISAQQYAEGMKNVTLNTKNASNELIDLTESALEVLKPVQKLEEAAAENIASLPERLLVPDQAATESFDEFIAQFSSLPTIAQQVDSAMQDIEGTVKESGGTFDEVFSTLDRNWASVVQGVAQGTQELDQAFKSMVASVLAELGKIAAVKITASLLGGSAAADGAVMSGGNMTAFAKGGVVSSPTLFPMRNGTGLMGEAGPEAIMPLARNSQGQLGVKAEGMSVVINNMAPGVEAVPRQTSNGVEIDIILNQAAAAVRRGGNAFAKSLEDSYALSRGQGAY